MNYPTTRCLNLSVLAILLITMLGSARVMPAYAAGTLTVLNTNDSGAGSLRQAIADAAAGNTIVFAANLSGATIHLQSTITNSLVVDKNLTIDGSALASKITISGDSDDDGIGNIRVFVVDAAVLLKGLIITKGYTAAAGGGIVVSNSGALTLINSTVSENTSTADKGGGIISYGSLTISGSTISNNKSDQQGAGIAAFWGALTVTNSTISSNEVGFGDGGGIWIGPTNTDAIIIDGSSINGNTALGKGGGIYNDSSPKLNITNSMISNNTAVGAEGGGIYGSVSLMSSTVSGNTAPASNGAGLYTGNTTITNSTIANNTAFGDGGGIYMANNGTAVIAGSTFAGNQAGSTSYGGAILNRPGATTIAINSTFSGNSAGYGGAIENIAGATLSLRNATISDNQSPNVGGIGGLGNLGTLHIVNTIIANSTNGNCSNIATGIIPTNVSNLVQDGSCNTAAPGDVKLGPLADNGGPTKTHALLIGSPAIDQGNNTYCADAATNNIDQRGYARPVNGDAVPGEVCDIGAYEYGASAVNNLPPTLNQPANLNILEDAGLQTVTLSGISAGTGESQALTISATSSNPLLFPHPLVSYTNPDATASLGFAPVADANGSATVP